MCTLNILPRTLLSSITSHICIYWPNSNLAALLELLVRVCCDEWSGVYMGTIIKRVYPVFSFLLSAIYVDRIS